MIIFSGIHGNHDLHDTNIYIKIKNTSINHVSVTPISRSKEHQSLKIIFLSTGLLTDLIPGKFKRDPRTGTLLMKPMTTGKKPLGEGKPVARTYNFLLPKSVLTQ